MSESDESYAVKANQEIGQRLQERFDFYLVALTFTILGLSAQTADFGSLIVADVAELVAWGALLLSGLKGLARLDGLPRMYRLFSVEAEQQRYATHLQSHAKPRGAKEVVFTGDDVTMPIDAAIQRTAQNVEEVKAALAPLESRAIAQGNVQRSAFAWGVSMLVVARAVPPLLAILEQLSRR